MTRINVVPPAELCNKHLLAEYRELPRVFGLAKPVDDAPRAYVLGKGHVRFFYDKLGYLAKRQRQIIDECLKRGFGIQHLDVQFEALTELQNDWEPTEEALALNRQRIADRLEQMGLKQAGGGL